MPLHKHLIFTVGNILAVNWVEIALGMTQIVNRIQDVGFAAPVVP
jgi:hypothetical protein